MHCRVVGRIKVVGKEVPPTKILRREIKFSSKIALKL